MKSIATGFENWYESRGLVPFRGSEAERSIPREHKWLKKVQIGMRRGYINTQVVRTHSLAESLLKEGGGREVEISLQHGGLLTITDVSDSDGRATSVQFDPERSNGIRFSAYYEDLEGIFSATGCHVRLGDPTAGEGYEFNTSDPLILEQNPSPIRAGLSAVRTVLTEADRG